MKKLFWILTISVIMSACGDNPLRRDWSIPKDEIESGLNANDDIPSIDNPQFSAMGEIDFMNDDEEAIVIKFEDQIRVYPLKILEWHELVNDQVNDLQFTVSHSTLSGMTSVWKREILNRTLNFGVSRYIYRNNQIAYDRETLNYWSQILSKSVSGNQLNDHFELIPFLRLTWSSIEEIYPAAQVMNQETGFIRNYDVFPYTDYKENDTIFIYDPLVLDNSLSNKEIVLGIRIDSLEVTKVLVIPPSTSSSTTLLDEITFQDEDFIVLRNADRKLLNVFKQAAGVEYSLDVNNEFNFKDNLGNSYDLFGEAILGPNQGFQLAQPDVKSGYWFVWRDYFEDIEIF